MTSFRRVDALPPYAFAEVERLELALRRSGEDVIDLGFGNPDVPPRRWRSRSSAGFVRFALVENEQRIAQAVRGIRASLVPR